MLAEYTPRAFIEPTLELLRLAWEEPTPAEAAAWGRMPIYYDHHSAAPACPATPLTFREALAWVRHGHPAFRHEHDWPNGGIHHSPRHVQRTLTYGLKARRYLHRVTRAVLRRADRG